MSDGGFNVDEHIQKRRGVTKLHSAIYNKGRRDYFSFPDIEDSDKVEYVKRTEESTESYNIESEIIESNTSKYLRTAGNIQEEGRNNDLKPTLRPTKTKTRLSVSIGETKKIINIEITKTNNDFEIKFIKFDRNLIDSFKNLVPRRRFQPDIRKWKVPYESEQQLIDFLSKYYNNVL